jgi:predicted transcriptional regulator YdeE
MKATPVDLTADLVVIGLPLRTSPEGAMSDIPAHWQKFMGTNVASRISSQEDDAHVYAVYCDYDSDHRGAYTLVIGFAVAPSTPVPEGLRRVRIPAGRYASFTANGNPAEVIWQTWTHINSSSEERARRYIADFERYAPHGSPTSVVCDVVVGLA